MDATELHRTFEDLRRNLAAGLRLARGRPLSREDFVVSLDQGFWLFAALIFLELVTSYQVSDKPASFSSYGLNYLGAIYLLDLILLLLIGRLAGATTADTGHLLIAYLAASPAYVALQNFSVILTDAASKNLPLSWTIWLLPFAWQLYILVRLLRLLLETRMGKALLLAAFNILVSFASLWILPYSELWYPEEFSETPISYAKLYELSVEDLFYNQPPLLEAALSDMAQQRPGVTDLYLLAMGGYGLEKVFLNEVEYVKQLFDERFDSRHRSLILVNNVETVAQYPLANRHNLRDALAVIGRRMDTDEDLLFLFMTSHGSSDHHFSVDFGPVPLDDLTPAQLRQALDDAGIRWRVIVVSSCYSGGFIDPLKEPHTLIITAAAPDRKSFGCGARSEFTDFGNAYFKYALTQQPDFIEAFDLAAAWVDEKEKRELRKASLPQRYIGEAIREKLAAFSGQTGDATAQALRSADPGECAKPTAEGLCPP